MPAVAASILRREMRFTNLATFLVCGLGDMRYAQGRQEGREHENLTFAKIRAKVNLICRFAADASDESPSNPGLTFGNRHYTAI